MYENKTEKISSRINDLPSMPIVIMNALEAINCPNSSANDLADILSKDQAITSQILKMVNSAYYGFPSQITTINRSIALLGMNKVRNIIMSVAAKPLMMSKSGKTLWEHSIRCAVGCEIISKQLGLDDLDEAFIIGLLHDIGKTVLEMYYKKDYAEVINIVNNGVDIISAERQVIGITHTNMGEAVVLKWKLPLVVANCVKYHHTPHASNDINNTGIVYIADRLAQIEVKYPMLDPDIMSRLDVDISDPMELREEIFETSQFIINCFN